MGFDLSAALVAVADMSGPSIVSLGRSLYMSHCVQAGRDGTAKTHDGSPVMFYPGDYDHAFYTAATKARRGYAKDEIDADRVARALWIPPVVAGEVDGTDCWRILDYGAYKKPPPEKRLYIVRRERYVVWLLPKLGANKQIEGWRFKTAYVTGYGDIDRYTKRQRKIWAR